MKEKIIPIATIWNLVCGIHFVAMVSPIEIDWSNFIWRQDNFVELDNFEKKMA